MYVKRLLGMLLLLVVAMIVIVTGSVNVEAQVLPTIDFSLPWKDGDLWRFLTVILVGFAILSFKLIFTQQLNFS